MGRVMLSLFLCLTFGATVILAEDPYLFFTWNVTYGTISPLGVPQRGILINGQFPGPNINSTTNNNIVINIFNNLDEPFLITWSGVQHRKNSWQDGMPGTNCPIPAGQNYTYHFQVKDQIGSYAYYPTTAFHKASGGFGGLRVNNRDLIPIPFDLPEDDFTVIVGDWFNKGHAGLKKQLDAGKPISRPDGVIINGQGGKPVNPLFTMKAGKTYRYRICNTGIKTTINFRIQGHALTLVELEGSHTVQNKYDSLDVHVGQCYSVLVTADQTPRDYYLVASSRFLKSEFTATAIIRYDGSKLPASPELPPAPVSWAWSLNQFRTFRWNLTSNAARPNPQGSYKYGSINITRTIKLSSSTSRVDGKLRYALNGVSHVDSETPLKLAEYFGASDKVFKYDLVKDEPPTAGAPVEIAPSVINATFRDFVEIIFENDEKSIQSYHLDGYSFFPVAIETGKWGPEKRQNYNLLDAVSRNTIQVYPKSWAAILLTFDNAGMWSIRSENWERNYLGQQLYVSVLSPVRSLRDEYNLPDNSLLCGIVKDMPKPAPYSI